MNILRLLTFTVMLLTQTIPCIANPITNAFKSGSSFCYQDGSLPVLAAINAGGIVAFAATAKYLYKKELSGKELKQLMIDAKNNPKKHKLLITIAATLVGLNGNFIGSKFTEKNTTQEPEDKEQNNPLQKQLKIQEPKTKKTKEEIEQEKLALAQKIAQQQFEITMNEITNNRQKNINYYTRIIEEQITEIKATKAFENLSTEDKNEMATLLTKYQEQRAIIHGLQQASIRLNEFSPGDAITHVHDGIRNIEYTKQEIPGSMAAEIKQQLYLLAVKKKEKLEVDFLKLNTENEILIDTLEAHHLIKKNKDKNIYLLNFKDFEVLSDQEYLDKLIQEKHDLDEELLKIDVAVNSLEETTKAKLAEALTAIERDNIEEEEREKRKEFRTQRHQIDDQIQLNLIKKLKAEGKIEEAKIEEEAFIYDIQNREQCAKTNATNQQNSQKILIDQNKRTIDALKKRSNSIKNKEAYNKLNDEDKALIDKTWGTYIQIIEEKLQMRLDGKNYQEKELSARLKPLKIVLKEKLNRDYLAYSAVSSDDEA